MNSVFCYTCICIFIPWTIHTYVDVMQACLLGLAWLTRLECLTLSHPVVHHTGTQPQVLSPGVSRHPVMELSNLIMMWWAAHCQNFHSVLFSLTLEQPVFSLIHLCFNCHCMLFFFCFTFKCTLAHWHNHGFYVTFSSVIPPEFIDFPSDFKYLKCFVLVNVWKELWQKQWNNIFPLLDSSCLQWGAISQE